MRHILHVSLTACTLLLAGCTLVIAPEATQPTISTPNAEMVNAETVHTESIQDTSADGSQVELLGVITVPNDTSAFDTRVGGLSAIAYDHEGDAYYFLSDDRATFGPARIYQAAIDLSDGRLDDGDLTWTGMIPLLDATSEPFAQGAIDPEGLVYTGDSFYVSTEGDVAVQPPIAPAILEFTPAGDFVASLSLPDKFIPLADGKRGVRNNQGLESLTHTADGHYLISGVENALAQDGPAATLTDKSLSRLFTIDLSSGRVVTEQVYIVDAIPAAPTPANGDADNGLAELVALDDSTLLALERSYAQGVGNTIHLYVVSTQGATDVSGMDALAEEESGETVEIDVPVIKELLVDFGELGNTLGVAPDNLEGLALGPQLPDGRQLLLVVSDNNFNPSQTTQLWALALTLSHP